MKQHLKLTAAICGILVLAMPCLCMTGSEQNTEMAAMQPVGDFWDDLGEWVSDDLGITQLIEGFILGYINGFTTGTELGYSAGWEMHDWFDPASGESASKVIGDRYEAYMETYTTSFDGSLKVFDTTWQFTNAYWSRMAEVSAAASWSKNTQYSGVSDKIISDAGIMHNIGLIYRSWESLIDTPLVKMENYPAETSAEGYDIKWRLVLGDTSYTPSSSMRFDLGTYVDGGRFYLVTDGASDGSLDTFYVVTTAEMVSDEGARVVLTPGSYHVSTMSSGYWTLKSGSIIGPCITASTSTADLRGAFAALVDGSVVAYAVCDDPSVRVIYPRGLSDDCADVGFSISYMDSDGAWVGGTYSVLDVLRIWDSVQKSFAETVATASSDAETSWMIWTAAGEVNSSMSVSAFIPDMKETSLTSEQKYLITVAAMAQMSQWYVSHSSDFHASSVQIPEESLDLILTGRILAADGTVIAEGQYTPMVWLSDMDLSVSSIQMTQPGYAAVWRDIDGDATYDAVDLVALENGCTLEINSIVYSGESVDQVTLHIAKADLVLSAFALSPDVPAKSAVDFSILITVICVIVALILGYIGFRAGNILTLILAAAIAAVGFLWPDIILGWIV